MRYDPPTGFETAPISRRALAGLLAGGALTTAPALAAAEDEIVARYKPFVHKDLWPYIGEAYEAAQVVYSVKTLPQLRAGMNYAKPLPAPAWTEKLIATRKDGTQLRVYLVNPAPRGAAPRPAILHIHGGGFVVGAAESWLPYLKGLAAELDCLIVTADYPSRPRRRFRARSKIITPHLAGFMRTARRWA